MDPFDSFRRPFPVVEDEDPFAQVKLAEEIQRAAQQSAQASIPAPMREPYEEEDPAIAQQKKEQLLKRIAAAHMQDKMNLAGTQATLRATQRMPSPVHGNFGSEQPPIDRSLVADAMRQKQMEDSMTLNPGMSRFLKGAPAPADPPRPTLGDSLAQQRQGAYKEGTMESGTQVVHMPDGSIALKGNYDRGDDGEPGIQLANMSPEDQAQQEFDRKVQADAMRQRLAERDKRENIRKGTFQQAQRDKMNGGFGGVGGTGTPPAVAQAQMLLDRYGAAALPIVGKMMDAMSQKEIAQLQTEAAKSLKEADWQHQSADKQADRTHESEMRQGDREFQGGMKDKELTAADTRSSRELAQQKELAEAEMSLKQRLEMAAQEIEQKKLAAQTDPRKQALGASINSDGAMAPEQALDFLEGKGSGPSTKLNIPAEPATPDRIRSALSTIRSQGEGSYDTPEEQEQLRQELLRQGITGDDLRNFQGSDYGDPSWYEWWDRGIAPYLSSSADALINERHANTPLLQALLGAQ